MGMFGRYTKKDYEVKSAEYKNRLLAMGDEIVGQPELSAGLNKLIMDLEGIQCPAKLNRKTMKQMDKEIDDLMDKMLTALQKQQYVTMGQYLIVIRSRLLRERKFGRATLSEMDLKILDQKAQLLGQIYDGYSEQEKCERRMRELEEAGTREELEAKIQQMEMEYGQCESRIKTLSQQIGVWKNRYNTIELTEGLSAIEGTMDQLPEDIASPRELDAMAARIEAKAQKEIDKSQAAIDAGATKDAAMAAFGNVSKESSFRANVAAKKEAQMAEQLSSVPDSVQSEAGSSFRAKIGK